MTQHREVGGNLRIPPWGSFVVTVGLLALAVAGIAMDRASTMAGAIIGYVAAYWLPARRDADE